MVIGTVILPHIHTHYKKSIKSTAKTKTKPYICTKSLQGTAITHNRKNWLEAASVGDLFYQRCQNNVLVQAKLQKLGVLSDFV